MKKLLTILAAIAIAIAAYLARPSAPSHPSQPSRHSPTRTERPQGSSSVADAVRSRASGVEVEGEGTVTSVLRDDNEGSPHQRFIVRLDSGETVLIAHNIDVAPRVAGLRRGDRIAFRGEYVWNEKGGLVHWTHRDPSGHHQAGWLRRGGETFE